MAGEKAQKGKKGGEIEYPPYVESKVKCACGNEFVTMSTKPFLNVDICSKCHPFYTGQQKFVDTGGRVEKFNQRIKKAQPTVK